MLVAGLEGQPEPARVKRGPRDEGRAQQHGLRQHALVRQQMHDKLPIRAQAGRLWGAPWITFTASCLFRPKRADRGEPQDYLYVEGRPPRPVVAGGAGGGLP